MEKEYKIVDSVEALEKSSTRVFSLYSRTS